ncbi:hypothetical protein Mesau_05543 [Mesorhizobium australicum WSM2073]|uniref:Uncharacterized protein n=3 Tax=Mesorhizobium TaxID=68287 RepID=L0KUV8_MESAW|nr:MULTISPECIES: hypothetical protein [Mesorhizobium]ADV14593.1 hypothetical protein Mesci_5496 [Mesorhizobium ciceri biovar biserrulae WSM1271]AEH90478.1 hypothetical protein Mesop_6076 [Mesorhizobium opportunistum WSM2075]AGB47848.1 hypothetical protein Mesau_05543 [Mesorhizobium australicum WSM2073]OBP90043.1 hypothetical protein BAE40_14200 [Mesorhizobium loti]
MADAFILNEHFNGGDRATIETILQGAGFNPRYDVPSDMSSVDPDTDIGVVGLPAVPGDLGTIDARTMAFAGAGIRVVAIWLHTDQEGTGGVPASIGKYATTVDRDSEVLMPTLKGETDVWEQPGGEKRPKPHTKRNKC